MQTTHIICIQPDQSLTYLQTNENVEINDEDNIVELIEFTRNDSITEEEQRITVVSSDNINCQCMFFAMLHLFILIPSLISTTIIAFTFNRVVQIGVAVSIFYDLIILNYKTLKIKIMLFITICVFVMKFSICLYVLNSYFASLFIQLLVTQYIFFSFLYMLCVIKMCYYSNQQIAPFNES
tara:strand:+ start:9175 stop:9717 length:543 start_codon:yes stop_codon:yes gene_type:complete